MQLTDSQRLICDRVLNVFETGTVKGKYGAVSIYHDGPDRIRQITYGRSQTTEYGNLRTLVEMYVAAGGIYSDALRPYAPKIRVEPLVDDANFIALLKKAGKEDPVMQRTQDRFFDQVYFAPALDWAETNGFKRALSMLAIYDSFIHSGRIRAELRQLFRERPPAAGGDERTWVSQYLAVRNQWLATHSNPEVRPSAYRTRDLIREAKRGDWDLDQLPIIANGTPVDDKP